MDWLAEWIWDGGEASPRNAWRCFRRAFALDSTDWDAARIAISADSRYVLWVNGILVGRGPVRSWPGSLMYDTWGIGHLLRPDGPNAIAVLVGLTDWISGGNYMFLRNPPPTGSILDFLGQWPWYLLAGEAVALLVYCLLDLPFRARRAS